MAETDNADLGDLAPADNCWDDGHVRCERCYGRLRYVGSRGILHESNPHDPKLYGRHRRDDCIRYLADKLRRLGQD
jgi:hypothetical protein